MESSVVELPDCVEIPAPNGSEYFVREPFAYMKPTHCKSALILLNQPLNIDLQTIWSNTKLHVCADGGTNHLYNYFGDNEEERVRYIPDFITGDFDSITDSVREYYTSKGAIVLKQASQYATDFDKAILLVSVYFHSDESRSKITTNWRDLDQEKSVVELARAIQLKQNKLSNSSNSNLNSSNPSLDADTKILMYVLGGIDGRFDQTIASIHQLYQLNETNPSIDLLFITFTDIIFLLKNGTNYIKYHDKKEWSSALVPICGLLPLGNKSVLLNTEGLKYDVKNWESDMLGKVSSSNGLSGINGVIVKTDGPIVMNIVHTEKHRK